MSNPALPANNLFFPTPPTLSQRIIRYPYLFIAQWLYNHQPPILPPSPSPSEPKIKLVCLSDTHNETPDVPDGDILLHAGDMTVTGTFAEFQAQLKWLNTLPHAYKFATAGNHDTLLDPSAKRDATLHPATQRLEDLDWGAVVFLNHTCASVHVRGRALSIFGSPMSRQSAGRGQAFQYPHECDVWGESIPAGVDVVVTHGPARGHLDANGYGVRCGCAHLGRALGRVRPRVAVWGHIHEGKGREDVSWDGVLDMYDRAHGGRGGMGMFVVGVVAWVRAWAKWLGWGVKRRGETILVNAAIVGRQGLGTGVTVEI